MRESVDVRKGITVAGEHTPRVYLDYAATAPFDERLIQILQQASWANANALHAQGREAHRQLEDARMRIARALRCRQPAEIVFTSGGTESCNMAVKGLLPANGKPSAQHVVVSAIEHHAVLDAAASLKRYGYHVHELQPNRNSVVTAATLDALAADIEKSGGTVVLVCVMAANNELGTVQPVHELAATAHAHGARFFADCVQALGKLALNMEESGVDAASLSAHKVGGPKGCGLLYLRRGVPCAPLVHGGGQEAGLRSGTSNVPGALACAAAVERATAERVEVWECVTALRMRTVEGLAGVKAVHALRPTLPHVCILQAEDAAASICAPHDPVAGTDSNTAPVVPHILNLLCSGLEGETLVQRLDACGISASSGSACSTGSLDPSHVLCAIGVPKCDAYGSLRLSFGAGSTSDDVDAFLHALPQVLR